MDLEWWFSSLDREMNNARSWLYIFIVFGLLFLGGCIATAATRSSHADWFPVIWLGAMAALCIWASIAILALMWYLNRPDHGIA